MSENTSLSFIFESKKKRERKKERTGRLEKVTSWKTS